MEYLSSIYSLENNVEGDFLGVQDHVSSPSSSSQSPAQSASSYSPMSNGTDRDSEYVPFNLGDLKIEANMDATAPYGTPTNKPFLRITEQPVEKFRFRYKSEMHGTHGALMGMNSSKTRKTFPTVELCNFSAGDAIIQCSLYQADVSSRKMHHSHKLVIRHDNVDIDDPHRVNVNQYRGYSVQFKGMGIIHTAKKYIADELYRKIKTEEQSRGGELSYRQETQLRERAERESKSMNLNQVCLCFEAFIENPNGPGLVPIAEPVYSRCINNMKSALTGELKICRLSTAVSSAAGQDELFMFVEKVGKKNIKVKFYELDENGAEVWFDWGSFTEIDVHHQYAIALTTPAYRNVDITSPVDVFIQLYRPSDEDCSEPMPFKYKPRDNMNPRKRQRVATSFPSMELPLVLERVTNPHHPVNGQGMEGHMPPPNNEELKIINDLMPSTDEYTFSGISSADLTDLHLLTCDGDKGGSSEEDEVAEQTLQVQDECEKLLKIYRIYGSGAESNSSVREKVLAIMRDYYEKYRKEASFLQDLLGYGDDANVRQITQILAKFDMNDLLREIDPYTNTNLLHTVCARNRPQFIRALASAGVDPSKQDNEGNSPLHLAVISGSTACVQALLQLPGLREVFNNDGYSPIHISVKARNLPITRLLLQADFHVTSGERRQGNNALHLAVLSKSLKSYEMILEKNKISIDMKNSADFSALEVAKALQSEDSDAPMEDELKKIINLLERNAEGQSGSDEDKIMDHVAVQDNVMITKSAADNKLRQGVEALMNQGHQWKELAHALGMDHIICVCSNSQNPTGTLFNLIEFESVDPKRIRLAISSLTNIDSASVMDVLEKILIR